MPRLFLSLAVAAGLALGAVGCSSDDGGGSAASTSIVTVPPPTAPATEAGLIGAGTDYWTAGNAGKVAEQYSMMSKRCLEVWPTADAWNGNVVAATKILNDLGYKTAGATLEGPVTVTDFTPSTGTVNAVVKTVDGKTVDVFGKTTWVYEDGGWRVDSCEAALP